MLQTNLLATTVLEVPKGHTNDGKAFLILELVKVKTVGRLCHFLRKSIKSEFKYDSKEKKNIKLDPQN